MSSVLWRLLQSSATVYSLAVGSSKSPSTSDLHAVVQSTLNTDWQWETKMKRQGDRNELFCWELLGIWYQSRVWRLTHLVVFLQALAPFLHAWRDANTHLHDSNCGEFNLPSGKQLRRKQCNKHFVSFFTEMTLFSSSVRRHLPSYNMQLRVSISIQTTGRRDHRFTYNINDADQRVVINPLKHSGNYT